MTNIIVFVVGMCIVLYVMITMMTRKFFGEDEDDDKKDATNVKSEVNALLEEDVFVVNIKNTDDGSSE